MTAGTQDRRGRMAGWLRRAVGSSGHERHTLLMVGKSALAAWIAWGIAHEGMDAQSPAFAPFSAVWMMHATVYQSVVQALRYVPAVAGGVALQGVIGFLVGPDLLVFGLVAVAALAIGQWRRLGMQGTQVATAAFFAFSTYLSATTPADRLEQLGQLLLLVLVGCGVGVAVNLLVFPPMRFHTAEYAVRSVAHSLCDLVADIRPALKEGALHEDVTGPLRRRAESLGTTVSQARVSVHTAQESVRYNPRRILTRHRHHNHFRGYAAVLDALERVSYQVGSLLRTLDQWHDGESGEAHRDFMRCYSDFLESAERVTETLSEIDETRMDERVRGMCAHVTDADERWARLSDSVQNGDLTLVGRPYGVLLVEATRLLEEFRHTCGVLEAHTPLAPGRAGTGPFSAAR